MTCIAALVADGTVWMGADAAGVSGWALRVRNDPKLYRVGDLLMGYTSSFRMGQLLGYRFQPPEHPADWAIDRYMRTAFVDSLRECFKAGGYARTTEGAEQAGDFLVGYRGRLFHVASDYQVGECAEGFDAVGCGADLAMGALYATRGAAPQQRITVALQAAEAFNIGVRGPFHIEQA
ncbi:MAG: hypothetical protein J0M00_17560 [Burkholderiales bacterium]|nr:hypothetical protein [Burkholderiales bacterium]